MDIVGYSRMATDDQHRRLRALQEIVRATQDFRRLDGSDRLIRIPTGDGMALVFFDTPVTAVTCAVEIARRVKQQGDVPLRIGVNSGPVYRIADINSNVNVAGEGINFAQRVMDCGDEGHLQLTKNVADVLRNLTSTAMKIGYGAGSALRQHLRDLPGALDAALAGGIRH
jgi:class 3 adenylate cyclase